MSALTISRALHNGLDKAYNNTEKITRKLELILDFLYSPVHNYFYDMKMTTVNRKAAYVNALEHFGTVWKSKDKLNCYLDEILINTIKLFAQMKDKSPDNKNVIIREIFVRL